MKMTDLLHLKVYPLSFNILKYLEVTVVYTRTHVWFAYMNSNG